MMETNKQKTYCGFVAVLGVTNAGKSTLVNRLVGTKVSITTHKVQTTRSNVRGIMVQENTQVILMDTPGFFKPKRRLDRAMHKAAIQSGIDSDVILFVVDASVPVHEEVIKGLALMDKVSSPFWLVLNKVDKIKDKAKLLEISKKLYELARFDKSFMISSVRGRHGGRGGGGFRDLEQSLVAAMPEGAWHFPEDSLSDLTERQFASELTRERLMSIVHQELPFHMAVKTKSWRSEADRLYIEQHILVQHERHKGIVLGADGDHISLLRRQSEKSMEHVFGQKVKLELTVKVGKNWDEDKTFYQEWDLPYDV